MSLSAYASKTKYHLRGSRGVHACFMAKKWKFFPFFFFSKIGQKEVFSNLLDRKLAILYYKNIEKWKFCPFLFFAKIDLVDRKQAILAYINIDLKKSKTLHFFQRG